MQLFIKSENLRCCLLTAAFSCYRLWILTENNPGGEIVRFRKDMYGWLQLLRGLPAASDPAPIMTDPNGSYTGRPEDPSEKPVQDADDL